MKLDVTRVDRIESLARESLRCAQSAVSGEDYRARALEAFREFHREIDPMLVLDLINEVRKLGDTK